MSTANRTNIVLVHGLWADGSSWNKVIPNLEKAGHRVIAVQLAAHSLEDDVATVKRAINLVGEPAIVVAHSFGGFVITNAGYNNKNVTGLVYVAAFADDANHSKSQRSGKWIPLDKDTGLPHQVQKIRNNTLYIKCSVYDT
jgi:pimeloyl-ACP methyl ester carboxylesterase